MAKPHPPDQDPTDDDPELQRIKEQAAATLERRRKKRPPTGRPFPKGVLSTPKPFLPGNTYASGPRVAPAAHRVREKMAKLANELVDNLGWRSKTARLTPAQSHFLQVLMEHGDFPDEPVDLTSVPQPSSPAEVLQATTRLYSARIAQLTKAMETRGLSHREQKTLDSMHDRLAKLEQQRTDAVLRALAVQDLAPSKRAQVLELAAGVTPTQPPPTDPTDPANTPDPTDPEPPADE